MGGQGPRLAVPTWPPGGAKTSLRASTELSTPLELREGLQLREPALFFSGASGWESYNSQRASVPALADSPTPTSSV